MKQDEATTVRQDEATTVAKRTEAVIEALGLNSLLQCIADTGDEELARAKARIASAIISDRAQTYAAHTVEKAFDRLADVIRDRPR